MNVVVTGASSGIGYQTVLEFTRNGHKVVALARSSHKLETLAQEAVRYEYPGSIQVLPCDLKEADRISEEIGMRLATIDILINNAGHLINRPFETIKYEDLVAVYQTNVFAPFILLQKLMPLFSPEAHIINIGSVGGVNGTVKFPGLSAYSSSKAALSCLTECLQAEFNDSGWTFNSLALGAVKTEMLEEAFPGYQPLVDAKQMAAYIFNFAVTAPPVLRGKTILVSRSTP